MLRIHIWHACSYMTTHMMTSRTMLPNSMSKTRLSRRVLHGITLSTFILTFTLIQWKVPDPYLDETLHILQTQRYCQEDFESWDPAIPNPPGLYLTTAIPLMTVHIPCLTPILRSTTLLLTTIVIPFLLSAIIASLSKVPSQEIIRHLLRPTKEALAISAFPLLFLFGNLYYTDVASLAGILGAWALALRGRHWSAALIGSWNMTVNQKNLIWLGFILVTSLLQLVKDEEDKLNKEAGGSGSIDPYIGQVVTPFQVIRAIRNSATVLDRKSGSVVKTVLPYLLPFGGYLTFLKWNGGTEMGHDRADEPILHVPQILYFIAFATIMLLPALLAEGAGRAVYGTLSYAVSSATRIGLSGILGVAILFSIHKYTIFHPSLLTDDRRYVYHLLRSILLPYPAVKYQLAPVYIYCFWAWVWRLRRKVTILWSIVFMGCTVLFLVPRPLIEPSDFLIPTILLRLQLSRSSEVGQIHGNDGHGTSIREKENGAMAERVEQGNEGLDLEYAWYTLINVVTMGLFLAKKTIW